MPASPLMLRLGVRGLALGGLAWASLQLALLVARLRFLAGTNHASSRDLELGIVLALLAGAAVWVYGRSDRLADGAWRTVRRRRTR